MFTLWSREGNWGWRRSSNLFAAGSVVPDRRRPASLLPGKLLVVVSLNPHPDHTRLVHNLLDDFATFADDFTCVTEKREEIECKDKRVYTHSAVACVEQDKMSSLTNKVPGYMKVVFFEFQKLSSLLYCLWWLQHNTTIRPDSMTVYNIGTKNWDKMAHKLFLRRTSP